MEVRQAWAKAYKVAREAARYSTPWAAWQDAYTDALWMAGTKVPDPQRMATAAADAATWSYRWVDVPPVAKGQRTLMALGRIHFAKLLANPVIEPDKQRARTRPWQYGYPPDLD